MLTQVPDVPVPELIIEEPATPEIVWSAIAPSLILIVGGILLLTVVSIVRGRLPGWFHAVWTVVVATGAGLACIPLWQRVQDEGASSAIAGAVGLDGFSLFVTVVICISVVLATLLLEGYLRREDLEGPEWYVLMLLSASGGVVMASANDLIVLFVGLEILSVSVYVLAAMHTRRASSQEAGMKYFVLGAFSSAILLYGIAFVYGAIGSTNLVDIQAFLADNVITDNGVLLAGLAFMVVGFGFKIAAVPFHMWAPDVYQGAPTPVAAFMASGVKAAAVAGLLRVFVTTFGPTYREEWVPMIAALAVLSLVFGSLLAIVQTNVKRLLAYSSISHAGFILLGVSAASDAGTSAALFYVLVYTFMVAGSFGVVTLIGRTGDGRHSIDDYRGLARARPGLAMLFAVFLLAQSGVPLTGGFLAKFYVIGAVAEQGAWALAVIAMLSAVIGAFLYLRVIVAMYFAAPQGAAEDSEEVAEFEGPKVRIPVAAGFALAIALVGTLALGIVPGPATRVANDATAELVSGS
ncbi:MAG: NADH-quinone oxidoreductase subunit N [Actinomycetia bacterium]|nr:NADH-quinone oxidoreductase subunit N [Actinomycetes bacterium]